MEELEATLMIDGQLVASALSEFDGTLEEMILESWRLAEKHATFATTEELRQRSGLAGVMIALKKTGDDESYYRVEKELEFWRAMTAATSGVPVDFDRLLADHDESDVVGLAKLWREFKAEDTSEVVAP